MKRSTGPLYETIRNDFLVDVPRRVRAVEEAAEAWDSTGDPEQLRRSAHRLSGAAGVFGEHGLADRARAIVDAVDDGGGPEVVRAAVHGLLSLIAEDSR